MSKRVVLRALDLYRRLKIWMMLVVTALLIFSQVFPATSVQASTPDPAERIFHNPIIILGPIPKTGLKASITTNVTSPPFTPSQIRKAYGIDRITGNGTGKTIAIVDAYGDPNISKDLQTFDAYFNLPNPTLNVYYLSVSTGSDSGWATETALDVEWAHAIAPGANILLMVAPSANSNDLLAAVDYANNHGADIVSMSWGGSEFSGETSLDSYFDHPNITYLASSGDSGAGVYWPASSQYVVGVGGTTLTINNDGTYGSETAWSDSGGGQSKYVQPEPAYQNGFQSSGYRQVPDVAFDADPNSGVKIYCTGDNLQGWYAVGGTSLSAPCWAGLYALANRSGVPWIYSQAATGLYSSNFHDITAGNNNVPGVTGFSAVTGYDMVTGLGSPIFNNLASDTANKLVFTAQPSDTAAAVAFPTQPVVEIQDAGGNIIRNSSASISIAITASAGMAGATLSGNTTVNANQGVATFSGLSIDKAGSNYTLTATSDALTPATSDVFTVSPEAATKLVFTTQPSGAAGGTAFTTQPVVTVQDASNNIINNSSASISLVITGNTGTAGAILSGTVDVHAARGVAAFSGLSIDKAGTGYTLTAASEELTSATSAAFDVVTGSAAKLAFTTQPAGAITGAAFSTQPIVAIQDTGGNIVSNSSASVSLSITKGTGTAGAALSGTTTVIANNGVAAFSGLSIDKAGTDFTLNASCTGLILATSSAFNISAPVVYSSGSGGGGGGGGSSNLNYLTQYMGTPGIFIKDASVKVYDGKATILIPKGTEFHTAQGWAGSYITAQPLSSKAPLPPVSGSIIGLTYQFGPEGATFDPPVDLKMIYDPSQIPSGKNENDLKIGYWDGNEWQMLDSTVDPSTHTITAKISHFSEYAVISFPPPSIFTLSPIEISQDKVNPGDTVTIQTMVSNIGGSPGSYSVILKVNGVQTNSTNISLEAGEAKPVTFHLQKDIPGDYKVKINGESGQFSVVAPPPPVAIKPTPASPPGIIAGPISTPAQAMASAPSTVSAQTSTSTPRGTRATFPGSWWILGIILVLGLGAGIIIFRLRNNNL